MSDTPTPSLPMLHLQAGMTLRCLGPLTGDVRVYDLADVLGLTADPKALRSAASQFLEAARAAEREQGNGLGRGLDGF